MNIISLIYIRQNCSLTKQIHVTKIPFLDLYIKVVDYDIHTSVYNKRDDFGFLL